MLNIPRCEETKKNQSKEFIEEQNRDVPQRKRKDYKDKRTTALTKNRNDT